ncbi:MAG: hypothetical protein Kow00121_37780 [Elainellaceae cyanobacterium]
MSDNSEMTADMNQAIMVDRILKTSTLPVTAEEREKLISLYPLVQQMAAQVRTPEIHHAEPALVYQAMGTMTLDEPTAVISRIKRMESMFYNNQYSEDTPTLAGVLPYVSYYYKLMPKLRQLDLGAIKSFAVMLAGGER